MTVYPFTGGSPDRAGYPEDETLFPLEQVWKRKLGEYLINPIVSDDTVVISLPIQPSSIAALDARTGKIRWQIAPDKDKFVQEFLCEYNGIVLFGNGNALFGAAIKDGKIVWKLDGIFGDGRNRRSGVIYKERFYVGGKEGMYCIDPVNGEIAWCYEMEKATNPAIHDDKVVFGDYADSRDWGGSLYCLDSNTGGLGWKQNLEKIGEYRDEVSSRTRSQDVFVKGKLTSVFPVIAENRIYGSLYKYLCSFDLNTGELIWKTDIYSRTPLYRTGRLYFWFVNRFVCVDAKTGEIAYKKDYRKLSSAYASVPFLTRNSYFVGTDTGVHAFDLSSGDNVWEFHSKKKSVLFRSEPVIVNKRLYAGCADGYLYCLESKTGGAS